MLLSAAWRTRAGRRQRRSVIPSSVGLLACVPGDRISESGHLCPYGLKASNNWRAAIGRLPSLVER